MGPPNSTGEKLADDISHPQRHKHMSPFTKKECGPEDEMRDPAKGHTMVDDISRSCDRIVCSGTLQFS